MFDIALPSHLVFTQVKDSDVSRSHELHPDERALLHPRASSKRLREFTLGRVAAHRALEKIGYDSHPPVLAGSRGEPLWPAGAVGSISHCDYFAAALVGRTDSVRGIGIDLQTLNRSVSENVGRRVCLASEMAWCNEDLLDFSRRLLRIFSVKETLFKALYPLCKTVFYFHDAEVRWDAQTARFEARLCKNLGSGFSAGRKFSVYSSELPEILLTYMTVI